MAVSYADVRGEWEERRISIVGVAKSFISQLRVGQDLTKVSLPSVFLLPYSLLEEYASRTAGRLHLLFDLEKEEDPVLRMLRVVSWHTSIFKNESYHHKPYNPVLGETHKCKVSYKHNGEEHVAYGISEQVSHHPPRTASRFDCPSKKIAWYGNIEPSVKFYRNSVSINSNGKSVVEIGNEGYFISKGMPDMHIQNTILGRKYVYWTNKVEFECPSTGIAAEIEYVWKDGCNQFEGRIFKILKPIISFKSEYNLHLHISESDLDGPKKSKSSSNLLTLSEGTSDGTILYIEGKNGCDVYSIEPNGKKKKKDRKLAIDFEDIPVSVPMYPPYDKQDETASLKIWRDVSKAIVDNDMAKADEAKKRVEDAQRSRNRELEETGKKHVPVNFKHDSLNDLWIVSDDKWYEKASELHDSETAPASSKSK